MKLILFLSLFFICSKALSQTLNMKIETSEFIFGENPPFAQCHASTIESLGEGNYMIAWFAGTEEKDPDVGIWMTKGKPGAWEDPTLLVKVREDAHWNPVLFNAPNGKLYIYFKVGKEIENWETWVQFSEDKGESWSEAKELIPGDKGGRGPVRNHILTLFDGTWLAPASLEKEGVWNAFVDISEDQGETWLPTETLILDRDKITGEGVIQPALWESQPLHVHMLLRTSAGKIGRSDSDDSGLTWSPVELTEMPNNNSGIDVAHFAGDTLALVYNPVGENWGKRNPIALAVSFDNGHTWPIKQIIEEGTEGDEFSYPTILHENGKLVFCYTWNRRHIKFVSMSLND